MFDRWRDAPEEPLLFYRRCSRVAWHSRLSAARQDKCGHNCDSGHVRAIVDTMRICPGTGLDF